MVIKTEVTVKGYKSIVKPKITLYQGDSLFLEFSLYNTIIDTINDVEAEESIPFDQLTKVELKLETPTGVDIIENCELNGNICRFLLKEQHTNEIGVHQFQLCCYDAHECKFHIPPISYEIRQLMG